MLYLCWTVESVTKPQSVLHKRCFQRRDTSRNKSLVCQYAYVSTTSNHSLVDQRLAAAVMFIIPCQ